MSKAVQPDVNVTGLYRFWLTLFFIVFWLLITAACQTVDLPLSQPQVYQSVWSERYPSTLKQAVTEGSLQGKFYRAASAASINEAQQQWMEFLNHWKPADGQYEDGMQARLVSWAELEIKRLGYLKIQDVISADQVKTELIKMGDE